ncbi:MAG: hypothetical protein MZW92_54100 [Comamonadaceae bacterium]|nr:hypothetical protein [Comamonadaceae bacterium]
MRVLHVAAEIYPAASRPAAWPTWSAALPRGAGRGRAPTCALLLPGLPAAARRRCRARARGRTLGSCLRRRRASTCCVARCPGIDAAGLRDRRAVPVRRVPATPT